MINIMDTLTPYPPFDPASKNNAVYCGNPTPVNVMVATSLSKKGNDRTVYSIKGKV